MGLHLNSKDRGLFNLKLEVHAVYDMHNFEPL
jgi:hypothetical protein